MWKWSYKNRIAVIRAGLEWVAVTRQARADSIAGFTRVDSNLLDSPRRRESRLWRWLAGSRLRSRADANSSSGAVGASKWWASYDSADVCYKLVWFVANLLLTFLPIVVGNRSFCAVSVWNQQIFIEFGILVGVFGASLRPLVKWLTLKWPFDFDDLCTPEFSLLRIAKSDR